MTYLEKLNEKRKRYLEEMEKAELVSVKAYYEGRIDMLDEIILGLILGSGGEKHE